MCDKILSINCEFLNKFSKSEFSELPHPPTVPPFLYGLFEQLPVAPLNPNQEKIFLNGNGNF